ncbi:MAG: hypothetical protein ABI598_03205 [Chloroflexota bacterium]
MLAKPDSQLHFIEQTDGDRSCMLGDFAVQTAHPRDIGALVFVVGLFVLLLVTTLLVPPG